MAIVAGSEAYVWEVSAISVMWSWRHGAPPASPRCLGDRFGRNVQPDASVA